MRTFTRMMAGAGAALLGLTMLGAPTSIAKGPPVGGEAEEVVSNNLSVPAVFVPSIGMTLKYPCDAAVLPIGGTTAFPELPASENLPQGVTAGDYYVQGEDAWQAGCTTALANTVAVGADWGDNLVSAPLKARTPIRVEMGLLADTGLYPFTGFTVVKLTDELDRYATYGTVGVAVNPYPEVRVWDAGAQLKIERTDGLIVYSGDFTAEINSTGRVVYGYNWQKPLAGDYVITFTAPNLTITTTDAGSIVSTDTVTKAVTVAAKAGGGGRP
ncbi:MULTISPECIES: hypothetical protein [unclassified Ornithinimicrobium]|uniref:hypothetical protein n=1 Tax=unclassified Ornithinimicrobium TaxID=2615080 RepID=UPI003853B7A6